VQTATPQQMIEQQVRAWTCSTSACSNFPQDSPRSFRAGATAYMAYMDLEVPLPKGQHHAAPECCGRLLQALSSRHRACARDWCGSGFITACLAAVSAHVESIEVFPELAELAKSNSATLSM